VYSISRPGGTAGWLWNFRLDDVGRWHDSELPSLWRPNLTTTSRASNSKSPEAVFSTRRLTRKPPGTARQLVHPMLSPGGTGYDRGRLISVPGPGAGNHDSPIALLLPHLPRAPEAGETTSRAGRGPPDGPDAGLGTMPHHSDRRGQLDPRAARLRHEPLG
jgi:hypothetical protein